MAEISEIFSASSQTNVLKDPTVTFFQKCSFLKFGSCPRNDSFGTFLVKT